MRKINKKRSLVLEKSQPLYMRIYNLLKEAIVNGDFQPGEEITETQLANQLDVSRTPIRDALKELARDGLIVTNENGETKIFSPTVFDIAEIYITRAALEAQAGAISAVLIDKEMLSELEELIQLSESAYKKNDIKTVVNCNTNFHKKIIDFSQNKKLIQKIETMQLQIMQIRRTSLTTKEHQLTSLNEHKEIIKSLRRGNGVDIQSVISNHILKAGFKLIEQIGIPDNPSPSILFMLMFQEEEK